MKVLGKFMHFQMIVLLKLDGGFSKINKELLKEIFRIQ